MVTDNCWDEALEDMPEATLAIRKSAFRFLQRGRPVQIAEAAEAAGLTVDIARQAAELVASVGMAELDGPTIVGMDGLTTRQTQHQLKLNGVTLWTWCAYDIVGIAAALKANGNGKTRCGMCRQTIEVVVRDGTPLRSMAIGWLPNESCSNVMAEFCPSALLFCSHAHVEEWRGKAGGNGGEALDLTELAERGRLSWRALTS